MILFIRVMHPLSLDIVATFFRRYDAQVGSVERVAPPGRLPKSTLLHQHATERGAFARQEALHRDFLRGSSLRNLRIMGFIDVVFRKKASLTVKIPSSEASSRNRVCAICCDVTEKPLRSSTCPTGRKIQRVRPTTLPSPFLSEGQARPLSRAPRDAG